MIDPSLLRAFVAVARSASFSRAAQVLNASQSAVSRAVQRLEDQIGTRLIERSTRSVTLTPAGEAFLIDARLILDRLAVAADNARRIGRGPLAALRIAICPTTGSWNVVRGIAAFRAQWQEVELQLDTMMSNLQPAALRASAIDVGIMQIDDSSHEGLLWEVVARHGLVVAVPGMWNIPPADRLRLADLRDRPWLMPSASLAPLSRAAFVDVCKRAGFEPRIVGTVDEPVTARIKIACGMGATFFHDQGVADPAGMIDLFRFDDPHPPAPAETAAVWSAESTAPLVRDFIRCLRENAALRPQEG